MTPSTIDLYRQIASFYARQMQLLDDGEAERWAGTFTEDGVFSVTGAAPPVQGRSDIAVATRRALDERTARGLRHRHWLGQLFLDTDGHGTVRARSLALVFEIPHGGEPRPHRSTVCEDVLVRRDGRWLVRERCISRDDLA